MSKKYYSRNQPIISRDEDSRERETTRSDWFNQFAAELEKASTQPKSKANPRSNINSTFDQINQILGNKSKYSSVQEAVLDMQKRTGLYDLLNKKAEALQEMPVIKIPEIFAKIPDMRVFIDNYVADRPGIAVDAVVHALLKIRSIKAKLPSADDVSEDVKRYINDKIMEAQMLHPSSELGMQIGKADFSQSDDGSSKDNDPFGGCMPAGNKQR
jgi:hypothetical protein